MATNDDSLDNKAASSEGQSTSPHVDEKPDESRFGIELGVDQNLPFSMPFSPLANGTGKTPTEELNEVFKEDSDEVGPTVRQLVAMRRMDAQARGLYRLLTYPLLAALKSSTYVPAEGGEAEAEFIENALTLPPESGGMSVTMHRFMKQLLMGLFDGFSAFEKVFWMPEFGPLQGKYTLKKLAHRPPETITFVTDRTGGFKGLRQRAQAGGKMIDVYIEPEYSFYFSSQEEERKFYGVSFFQSAFYHYDKKVKMYYIAHLAAQRAAVGTRVGTHPQNATRDERRNFSQQLQNMSIAQWLMAPEGYKVESLKEVGGFAYLEYINHHNAMMAQSLLAGFFNNDAGGSTSEKTPLIQNNQPGDEMFKLMLTAIMDEVANQINHYIIPQLIDWNFSGGKYPEFTWGKLTDEQKSGIAATFDKLASAQTVTPEFLRAMEEHQAEAFGLDIDYEAIEEREAEEAAMLQEQIDAGNQQLDAEGNPIPAAPGEQGTAAPGAPDMNDFAKRAMALTHVDDDEPAADVLLKLAREMLDVAEGDFDE